MAAKKPAKNTAKKKRALGGCPNPGNEGRPYSLMEFVGLLKDKAFAGFFLDLLKLAEANDKAAIECVNSYLAPTVEELENLGIPASQIESLRKCTDSGLLVVVTAQQNAQR
jgi:hypothetical protein